MKNDRKNNVRKWSLFMRVVFIIASVAVMAVIGYTTLKICGGVEKIRAALKTEECGAVVGKKASNNTQIAITFGAIEVLLIVYIIISLYFLFTHKAVEDNRMFSLHIIIAPIFLVAENALLNLMHKDYYQVTMPVFAAIVTSVITFAGLRFSFEISAHQRRFKDTADAKPDIKIEKAGGNYTVDVERNDCYLCGAFIGRIHKLWYKDTLRTGSKFEMFDLIYPNKKKLFRKKEENGNASDSADLEIAYHKLNANTVDSIYNEKIDAIIQRAMGESNDVFLIFRDMVNYYYFVRLPYKQEEKSYAIGVSEYTMNKLVWEKGKSMWRIENHKKQKKNKPYITMDWFGIPYNFYPTSDETSGDCLE